MYAQTIDTLLKKYWSENITRQEYCLLMKLLEEKEYDRRTDYGREINSIHDEHKEMSTIRDADKLLQHIHLKIQLSEEVNKKKTPLIRMLFNKLKWVAALLLYFFFQK